MAKKFAWSYSALTAYETCPKQFYHLRVAKDIREKPSRHLEYGNYVHKALEDRVAKGKPLPGDLSQYEPVAKKFESVEATADVQCELSLAFREDYELTEWFARDTWLRCKLDVAVIREPKMHIYDYKTGKRKVDDDQLKLFAAAGFTAYPEIEQITAAFIWLPDRKIDRSTYTRDEEPLLWQEFQPRVDTMAEAHEKQYFPARPSGLCRGWCPVKTCEHWEERKDVS